MAENKSNALALREYQLELLEAAKERNIIVCLGTGTGKTFISIKLIEHLARVDKIFRPFSKGAKRTFFLVNSVPLVFQQADAIKKNTALKVEQFCGEMGVDFWSKNDWLEKFEHNHVLVMTHQIYLDLLLHAKLRLSQANLLVFDECHHAHKNHPFKRIMDYFANFPENDHPRILGLTASVVGTKVKPQQIGHEVKKLEHTLRCVCKTASDPNVVEKYGAKPKERIMPYSSSNNLDEIAKYLECEFHSVLDPLQKFLQDMKVVKDIGGSEVMIVKELDVAKSAVRECLAALDGIGIWAAYEVSIMLVDDLGKRSKKVSNQMASLILQTTVTSLQELGLKYNEFRIANLCGRDKIQQKYLKPKVKKLLKLFASKSQDDAKVCSIVFVERRYAACVVSKLINALASEGWPEYRHLKSDFVTGHGSDLWGISATEMNFNAQKEKLKKFRAGEFNVLVGTSVVEEGVDIPKCNLVVMFDFPNNYRAFVQSRGRGRAKDAEYVLLVNKDDLAKRRQEQEMYQHVDKYLTQLCQRNRDEPTDEEALEAVNVYALDSYFTEKNAKLDMGNSIPLLYRYCSKLPCDRFTSLKPKFTIHDVGLEFQCSLKMPGNSHVTGIIKGDPMPSIREARQAVAQIACRMLHEHKALDEHLVPAESSSESETEDEIDGPSQPKTGTRKRQRLHTVKTSKQLYGELTTDGSKKIFVYFLNMAFDDSRRICNPVKKNMWDRKIVSLGIITNVKLPEQLPSFCLFNDIGKLTVALERCRSIPILTSKQRKLVDWFHSFIFTETLEFKLGLPTGNGCRVVLLNSDDHALTSGAGINFNEMELLMKKVEKLESNGRVTSDTDLLDSVVIQSYNPKNRGHYFVSSISDDYPCSRFPNQTKAGTYKQYFEEEYSCEIRNLSQPLVNVVNHSRKIDCRRSETSTKKYRPIRLSPETLEFRKSPQSLTLRALFVPAVLYRVDSLICMSELRDRIDVASNIPCVTNTPESPRKKMKRSFNIDLSREEEADRSQARETSQLSQYFYPFDISKSVPLFKLLEAVTCASSGEDFNLERLEMLGDSFLKMAVSIHVYWHRDHKDEGKLTKYRTKQISNKNLFKLAEQRCLSKHIKSVFSKETWVPPGFTAQSKQENGNLSSSSDDDDVMHEDVADDVIDGHVQSNDVMKQLISDKSVADSMEALIGAHFIHCGYMGALGFMTWLGVDVLHTEAEEPANGGRRKSPTPQHPSEYANYPLPSLDPPTNEDSARYEDILNRETKEIASFEEKIHYTFENKVLLLEAFTHPTYNENTITGSYQRLEFLGDAILDFLVTHHIYNNSERDLKPGELTDLRSALVNNNIFAVIAVNNDYHKYLKEYSPALFSTIGHFVNGVQQYQQILGNKVIPDPYVIAVQSDSSDVECIEAPKPLGDVFESVAGAIFLDSGLNLHEVWRVCHPLLKKYIDEYSKNVPKNPVRSVKELDGKAKFSSAKPTEDSRISCALTFKGQNYEGVGRNKHNAQLSAAYKALKRTDYKK